MHFSPPPFDLHASLSKHHKQTFFIHNLQINVNSHSCFPMVIFAIICKLSQHGNSNQDCKQIIYFTGASYKKSKETIQ